MKKLINYICLVITLTFFFITNVYAYGCKSGDIEVRTSSSGAVSSRTFTLTDKQNRTCTVTLKSASGGRQIRYYIEVDGEDQSNRKNYSCKDTNVKFSLDGDISKGFNLENIQCSYSSTNNKFSISGISGNGSYGSAKSCTGDDYLFTKDGKTCKVVININEYKQVTLKYGDKDDWKNATSKSNPEVSEFDCVVGNSTIHIKSDTKIANGYLTKCPKLSADVDSDLDNSDGDHTERNDTNTTINPDEDYDHGIGDLISKWFGGGNNGNMTAGEMNCNNVIKGTLGQYLTKIFSIMKYLGIVLCVGMTIYEFVKALLDSDKEVMNKLVKKAFTRLILVAVLFFLPLFVNLLVSIFVDNPCPINF